MGDDEEKGVGMETRRQNAWDSDRSQRLCPGTDPSRHLLQGPVLANQTPSVRLVQPGGFPGSHARRVFDLLREWVV